MVHAFARADLRATLGNIDVATLLLYGEQDERAPRSVADALHASIRDSRLRLLPAAGHLTNLEVPGPFADAVRSFLRDVEATA